MEKSDSHGLGFAHEVLAILEVVDREDQLRRIPNVVASDILRNGSVLIRVRGSYTRAHIWLEKLKNGRARKLCPLDHLQFWAAST